MHGDLGSLMSDQQTNAYGQWQSTTTTNNSHSIMSNQTFDHSTYHPMPSTADQQMLMLPDQQVHHQAPIAIVNNSQSLPMNNISNNYIGPTSSTPSHAVPVNSNENGSTSDDSDDNALHDPNVSKIYSNSLHNHHLQHGMAQTRLQFQCYD
jgi:hypothetical protein